MRATAAAKMTSLVSCRLCLKEANSNHATAIFSSSSKKKGVICLLEYIFDVSIKENDGKSKYVCRNCYSAASNVNDKLQKLREVAHRSYLGSEKPVAVIGIM